jgi:transcriptional regulator with XRE-family HTH domain
MNLGETIKKARIKSGMTQLELSQKLGLSSSQFVSLFESGKSKVPLDTLNKCCEILGIKKEPVVRFLIKNYEQKVREALK